MISKIKIIISEIDGIITDGSIPIDELGYTPFKNYCLKDFEAINKIKSMFKFIFISNNSSVNYNLCRKKNIPFSHSTNKKQTIIKAVKKYNFTFSETKLGILSFHSRMTGKKKYNFKGEVLELGAGSCWFSALISKTPEIKNIYALDISEELLKTIGNKIIVSLKGNKEKIKFVNANFHKLPFDNNKFDVVVCDASLHHAQPRAKFASSA